MKYAHQNEENAIVVAGGIQLGNGGPSDSVEVFMTSRNAWKNLGNLRQARGWYPILAVFDHKLHCLGGKVRFQKVLHHLFM